MVSTWLIASLAASSLVGLGAAVPRAACASQGVFFDADEVIEGRYYIVSDQRGNDAAREMSLFLDAAFPQFEDLLRARPKIKAGRLRVDLVNGPRAWKERLRSLGIDPRQIEGGGHYDAATETVLVRAQATGYMTRVQLLRACLRQFHHLSKAKNEGLLGHWFVVGLSEVVSMHRWNGARLEVGAKLALSAIDLPAMALDSLRRRPLTTEQFRDHLLRSGPMAWTLTSFLMVGEDGKHRKRFQKLALGHRGSMLDGEQLSRSLGSPADIGARIETWLRSVQLPLEVLSGDFEDRVQGQLTGTGTYSVPAIASPRAKVHRLSCTVDVADGQGAGLVLDYESPYSLTYFMVADGRLWSFVVRRGKHEAIDCFRQPRAMGGKIEFEAIRADGRVEVYVNGGSVGSLESSSDRLALIVQRGQATFTDVEWE